MLHKVSGAEFSRCKVRHKRSQWVTHNIIVTDVCAGANSSWRRRSRERHDPIWTLITDVAVNYYVSLSFGCQGSQRYFHLDQSGGPTDQTTEAVFPTASPPASNYTQQTNLSLEDGFDSNATDEVEPDDVKSLQHQQQTIEQPPGLIRPSNLPALKQDAVDDPKTRTRIQSLLHD